MHREREKEGQTKTEAWVTEIKKGRKHNEAQKTIIIKSLRYFFPLDHSAKSFRFVFFNSMTLVKGHYAVTTKRMFVPRMFIWSLRIEIQHNNDQSTPGKQRRIVNNSLPVSLSLYYVLDNSK